MIGRPRSAARLLAVAALLPLLQACGDSSPAPAQDGPAIARTDGAAIAGTDGWRWIPFADSTCTDAISDPSTGRYRFGTSTTGLAISWGPQTSTDLVVFLQGGG